MACRQMSYWVFSPGSGTVETMLGMGLINLGTFRSFLNLIVFISGVLSEVLLSASGDYQFSGNSYATMTKIKMKDSNKC